MRKDRYQRQVVWLLTCIKEFAFISANTVELKATSKKPLCQVSSDCAGVRERDAWFISYILQKINGIVPRDIGGFDRLLL
jgi:hypothetical protein